MYLTCVFDSDGDIDVLTNRFLKKLNGCIAKSFKKNRVTNNVSKSTKVLYEKMNSLK